MGALYVLVATLNYRDRQRRLDDRIYNQMRLFSYHPIGDKFEVDFVPKEKSRELARLYHDAKGVYGYFEIPGSQKYLLKLSLPITRYKGMLQKIFDESFAGWFLYLLAIAVVSILLALYSLYPLKRALVLNEEFVRDILHDFNTPLSSLRVNLKILKKRHGEERCVGRMESALETIHTFQANLRAFLNQQEGQKERFDLRHLLEERLEHLRAIYPAVTFRLEVPEGFTLECNRRAFLRIVENLLGNAGKYNIPGGEVRISLEEGRLQIEDTGIGIKNPERVFDRYYKEGERGLGLGLHIVRKLCDELKIPISLESRPGEGTKVTLDLSAIRSETGQ